MLSECQCVQLRVVPYKSLNYTITKTMRKTKFYRIAALDHTAAHIF